MNILGWVVVGCIGLADLNHYPGGIGGIGQIGSLGATPPPTEDEIIDGLPFSSTEQVLVIHDQTAKVEHLVIELRFDKADGTFGTLIPLPSPPTKVEKVAHSPFDSLRGVFAFTPLNIGLGGSDLNALLMGQLGGRAGAGMGGSSGLGTGTGTGAGAAEPPEPPPPPVEVLEQQTVGSFESFTLAVHDAAELAKWLGDHGLTAPRGVEAWAARYMRMGFSFVALKFTQSADAGKGMTSETLRVTFPTPQAYFPYSEPVSSKQSKRLLAAWVISDVAVRPVARQTKDGVAGFAQPWRPGERFTATHDELATIFKDLADVMPAGDKATVQTFRDWKASRAGWGDVVFVPQKALTFDDVQKTERKRMLGLLDNDLVPPPPPPPAVASVAAVTTPVTTDTPAPSSTSKDGCNAAGATPGMSSLLLVVIALCRRRSWALLLLAAGCHKQPVTELAAGSASASASALASASASASVATPEPVSTLPDGERAAHETVAFSVLAGEVPDGGYAILAGTAPVPPPPSPYEAPADKPSVTLGQLDVQGDLDKAIIRRYLARNKNRTQYCYEHALLQNPGLSGSVNVQFFIGSQGTVTASTASGVSPEVASCIANMVRTLEFPKPPGGGGVTVRAPYRLKKGS